MGLGLAVGFFTPPPSLAPAHRPFCLVTGFRGWCSSQVALGFEPCLGAFFRPLFLLFYLLLLYFFMRGNTLLRGVSVVEG